ncbi:MAG: hypothetical protein ACI9LU_002143 [Polaribacter sp.]|jgi:hypothetical protein
MKNRTINLGVVAESAEALGEFKRDVVLVVPRPSMLAYWGSRLDKA